MSTHNICFHEEITKNEEITKRSILFLFKRRFIWYYEAIHSKCTAGSVSGLSARLEVYKTRSKPLTFLLLTVPKFQDRISFADRLFPFWPGFGTLLYSYLNVIQSLSRATVGLCPVMVASCFYQQNRFKHPTVLLTGPKRYFLCSPSLLHSELF